MADFDLFEIVGLAFDPPETNAKQVKKKIEQKSQELGSAFGRESQQITRDAIQAQKEFLDKMLTQLFTTDGKKLNVPVFKPLAEKKTKDEMHKLSASIALLKETGEHEVTDAMIRHYKKETRLSIEHVKQVFTDAGFTIIDINPLAAYPKFPTNADRIYQELDALSKTKDPNPNGADTSVVTDLYAFAAYISNDIANMATYRAMDTKALFAIFDSASQRFSQRNDDLGKLCGSLSAAAKTFVFNNEENRAAYDLHLKYCSEELTKLFTAMKNAPKSMLLNPKFADPCIKKICAFFPQYEVALAIYNKEAGFTDVYYFPTVWVYTIKCNYCGVVCEFDSESTAIRENSCKNCHKPLFKKCNKCGRSVPDFKDSCPYCNYVFASAALFAKFYQKAEAAFRGNDFDAARQFLFQAQTAAPGEKSRIEALAKQIEREEMVLREPINRLKQLIAERKYYTARTELGAIIKKFPSLNVAEFERVINNELSAADRLFASAVSYTPSKKADVCISILMNCVDYLPALSFLRSTPPLPVNNIVVSQSSSSGNIQISWGRSSEQGVSYRLIRKNGKYGSSSENDGEILLENTNATSYTDESVKPGVVYTYSVFTVRREVYSSPVSKTGMLYTDVRNCHVVQRGSGVRITWDSPVNSSGTTVTRSCNGKTVTLTESAYGSYEDTSTKYGNSYTYKVYANYGSSRSAGVEKIITPLPTVDSFLISASQVKENVYKVSWSIAQRGIDVRVMVNGNVAKEAKSNDNSVQVTLPKETFCTIVVAAYSEGKWINSENAVEINTYTACSFDRKATRLEETLISGRNGDSYRIDLRICLSANMSPNVSAFYYTVRSSKTENRWAEQGDIGRSNDIKKISLSTYQKHGCIPYQDSVLDESAFFVTVFTCYSVNGKEIISEPQRMKIDRPLLANMFWSVSYGLFDGLKLNIEMSGNKPIEYIPKLYLCVCDSDQFILSQDDTDSRIIKTIQAVELDNPVTDYCNTYTVEAEMSLKQIKKCKFFLFEDDPGSGDNITIRWENGFKGKV
ncbi:hypothetical protein SAMN02910456_01219 [Ruminococcaceae bacterium YRB3002]|nr:hypothetical protein SAMN02910456_01219 [Ruminococcaceae bacterium YRB3002]